MNLDSYTKVDRPHGSCLLHNSKHVWIVEYPATRQRAKFWQVYQPIAHVPAGRDPWTINNKRIGPEDGFQTLEAAIAAGDEA